jgi:ubiquinone/menaquinone biosynthesis C-methylase UbiE
MDIPGEGKSGWSDVYVMGRTSEEYQRLRRQAQVWEKATTAILDDTGLREGMTCLDVGCGPGEVMRLMGERVGRKGKVTGLDNDGTIGREALGVLKSLGTSNFEFIEGNVEQLQDTVKERYDTVYARFLLLHLKDPVSALRKMHGLTRPGGSIVIQDYDFRTWDAYSEPRKEIRRTFFAVYEKVGRDLSIGSNLPSLFVQAGIGPPDGTRVDGLLTPPTPMALAVYQSVLPLALKLGITTEETSKAVIQKAKMELDDKSRYGLWPLCIGAWKRKPV